jgi:DNA-binding FadR family transcriptional regulator
VGETLEGKILDGSFPADTKLPSEADLAIGFGVSRTVIRDALRLLEARGLVEIKHGSGTLVKATSVDAYSSAVATMLLQSGLTIGDVFAARAALEGQLAVVAARNHTPKQIALAEAALERFEETVRQGGDAPSIVRAHVGFHSELFRATNLAALEILLAPIQDMMQATSVVGRGTDPRDPAAWRLGVHRHLLEAVRDRDEQAVATASAQHWDTPLNADSYAGIRSQRLDEMLISPRELVALPYADNDDRS